MKIESKFIFFYYPKCSTCQKAKRFLETSGVNVVYRDIVLDKPNYQEIKSWQNHFGLEIRKIFNRSGILYRTLGIKDKIQSMTDDEIITLLSSDGKLIKRPILVGPNCILFGFKEEEWRKELL